MGLAIATESVLVFSSKRNGINLNFSTTTRERKLIACGENAVEAKEMNGIPTIFAFASAILSSETTCIFSRISSGGTFCARLFTRISSYCCWLMTCSCSNTLGTVASDTAKGSTGATFIFAVGAAGIEVLGGGGTGKILGITSIIRILDTNVKKSDKKEYNTAIMVSYIIESKDFALGQKEIERLCTEKHISPMDQLSISLDTNEKSTQSIGIQEIKKLKLKVFLKPMQSQEKAVIIQDAETLTTEAQNALLKIIEEPPAATYIYLVTKDVRALLPTILSRCSTIRLDQSEQKHNEDEELSSLFQQDLQTLSGKLAIAEKYGKQKTNAVTFLEQLLEYYHEQLHNAPQTKKVVGQMKMIQTTLNILQNNERQSSPGLGTRPAVFARLV